MKGNISDSFADKRITIRIMFIVCKSNEALLTEDRVLLIPFQN